MLSIAVESLCTLALLQLNFVCRPSPLVKNVFSLRWNKKAPTFTNCFHVKVNLLIYLDSDYSLRLDKQTLPLIVLGFQF
jgi:hypothetical protein